jgi:hypothetical protein
MRATCRGLATVLCAGLLGAAVLAGGAGCDALGDTQRVGDRTDLVNDLAARLTRSDTVSYTAQYQLSGGSTGSIAQTKSPPRIAYTYPGGKLIMVPRTTTDCHATTATMTCTRAAAPSPAPEPPPAALSLLASHGMIAPAVVVGLLNAAALDSDAAVDQRDTTIAGQHATCVRAEGVDNAAAPTFEVCVTTDGVIGSFTGTVNGDRVEIAMVEYRASVRPDAFELPAGARLVETLGGTR